MAETTTKNKILQAASESVYELGIAKLTLDDVAQRANVSRATVYRHFPNGRDQVLSELVALEAFNWLSDLAEKIEGLENLEDLATQAIMYASESLRNHSLLNKVLKTERDLVISLLAKESHRIIAFVHLYVVTRLFSVRLPPQLDRDELAEYIARMMLSFVTSPGKCDLRSEDQVREIVKVELLGPINFKQSY